MKNNRPSEKSWFIQAYFVVATLIGLLLLVIASVNIVSLGTRTLLGVKPFPSFPPTPLSFAQQNGIDKTQLTAKQQKRFDEIAADYERQMKEQAAFDHEEQSKRTELAWSLAMLIVGVPVFAIHAPRVFRKDQA
jgi:hypothetical protein